jgi:hypothetical protein
MHAALAAAHPQWDDHIEVAYVPRATLKTFRTERSQFANISPGEPFHVVDVSRHWLLNWYVVQERGLVLYGLPAREVIDPISRTEYQQVVCDHLDGWGEWIHETHYRKAQAYAILTMCRAMVALEPDEKISKSQAALWAEQTLPEWSDVIRDALAWRAALDDTGADAEATFERTVHFVESVRARERFRCSEA